MKVLLTGGAGYIGSHTVVAIANAGYTAVILDDFSNSNPRVIERLRRLVSRPLLCEVGSVADMKSTRDLIERHGIGAVIHFAAHKAVGESVAQPLKYYDNNLRGLIRLLQAMDAAGCRRLVFSSSASVYASPATSPIAEDSPRSHTNPYGHTKLICEDILSSLHTASPDWQIAILRYFNPVGAHPSGLIGEDPNGTPSNLVPCVSQVAIGKRPFVLVHGSDYPTPDGTGIRDYIHIDDLARGHVAALNALLGTGQGFTVNLGTGRGHSVLEVLRAFEEVCGRPIRFQLGPRRQGDVAQCYADVSRAHALLRWRAERSLRDMCADAWRWQTLNPDGYATQLWHTPKVRTIEVRMPASYAIPFAAVPPPFPAASIPARSVQGLLPALLSHPNRDRTGDGQREQA